MASDTSPTPSPLASPDQALVIALSDPRVARVYASTFFTFTGAVDVTVMLGVAGVASGVLNLSYPLAKALSESLAKSVTEYERLTGQKIPATAELDAAMRSGAEAKAAEAK